MGHDWILDVLVDLETFAKANGMPTLPAQLSEASFVAQAEISSNTEGDGLGILGQSTAIARFDSPLGVR